MARFTTLQKNQLNNMNKASQRAALGTRLDTMEYKGASTPVAGTLTPRSVLEYEFAPANADNDAVHAAVTLSTAVQTVTTGIGALDFPRCVCIVSNAAITTKVTINGTDIEGTAISEELTLNGATPVNSTRAFKTVTSIVYPIRTNVGDTVTVGYINTFGMPHVIPYAGCLLAYLFNGTTDTSGALTVDASLSKNVYALNGTPDNSKKVALFYLV